MAVVVETSKLISKALAKVEDATGEHYTDVRTALLELAEDGAFAEYVGGGQFEDDFQQLHIDEMTDRHIARLLIRSY